VKWAEEKYLKARFKACRRNIAALHFESEKVAETALRAAQF